MKMKQQAYLKYHRVQLCEKLCKLVWLFKRHQHLKAVVLLDIALLFSSLGGIINLFNIHVESTNVFRTKRS